MSTDRDLHALTGAYLLGSLPDDERHAFEDHLDDCADCREEIARLTDVALVLAPADVAPPTGLRDRIVEQAKLTPQEAADAGETADAGPEPVTGLRPSPWLTRLTAAAVAVLLVAVGGLSIALLDVNERLAETRVQAEAVAELLAAPDLTVATADGTDGVTGRVLASASAGDAIVTVDGLTPAPADRTYQLWVIDGDQAASAGLFDTDADGRTTQALPGEVSDGQVIGITLEPAGGSPQPTTDPVLAIELP